LRDRSPSGNVREAVTDRLLDFLERTPRRRVVVWLAAAAVALGVDVLLVHVIHGSNAAFLVSVLVFFWIVESVDRALERRRADARTPRFDLSSRR
jgi:hypothetical protein